MANLAITNLYLLAKDHKDVKANGDPRTHPVCTASDTINIELSELIVQIIEAAIAAGPQAEVLSTEELLAQIDSLNKM